MRGICHKFIKDKFAGFVFCKFGEMSPSCLCISFMCSCIVKSMMACLWGKNGRIEGTINKGKGLFIRSGTWVGWTWIWGLPLASGPLLYMPTCLVEHHKSKFTHAAGASHGGDFLTGSQIPLDGAVAIIGIHKHAVAALSWRST